MDLIKNNIYRAECIDYTAEGSAVARIEGIAVFVPNGAVGDICDIRILKVNRRMAFGKIEQILTPSPSRIVPACPHAAKCGGCCWQHIDYAEELRAKKKKVQDALTRIGGFSLDVEEIIGATQIHQYRNKAQYPVGQDENGHAITGFYRQHSHDIVATDRCLIQHEIADQATALIRTWMDENHITAYNEYTGQGIVRHVFVRIGTISKQTQVCIVAATAQLPAQKALVELLSAHIPSLVSIIHNCNTTTGNVILGEKNITLWGSDTLEDTLCENTFQLSPHAFYQVNHAQTQRLYACALAFANVSANDTVIDLYCGAGTITLALARQAKRVVGVENVPAAIENAKQNAARNHIANVDFLCADAGQAATLLATQGEHPNVLVVDPPRKGLDALAIEAIGMLSPNRLVYVSCDPATLARDVKLLAAYGYTPTRCKAFDLFPRTAHVETIIMMTYCGDKPKK